MSKGLRRGLIAVLVIAAVAYVGAKLYVRSQADMALREAAFALRDSLKFSYEGFSAGLDGSLTLEDLSIRPIATEGEIFIRRLTIAAGSLPDALSVRRHLDAGRLPEALTLNAEDLRLNFDSRLYRSLQDWSGGFMVGTPLDHLACGEADTLDTAALEAMGYAYLGANARLNFNRGRDQRAALITAEINAEDIARVRGEAVLRVTDGTLDVAALRTGSVGLADADLRYRDEGYFEARNYYCAAQLDSDVETFLAGHRSAVADYLRRHGAVPSEAFLQAYGRLIGSAGNEFHLALSPGQPVLLRDMTGMTPQALSQAMAPSWAVNGEAVETLIARWVTPSERAPRPGTGTEQSAPAQYFAADPGKLNQLVGSFARLTTYDGTTHQGVIQEASGSRITMQRRFQGGDMSFGVSMGDIKTAEIYRREPLPVALRPQPEAPPDEETTTVVVPPDSEPAQAAGGEAAEAASADNGTSERDADGQSGAPPRDGEPADNGTTSGEGGSDDP
ncbi:hypothetical protein H0Z60_03040 [Ectothiorhodospiraceae bacterium WFHF3C12]|nr:hypothetical protein [Ectothiorhodospiraceae bacterium WFHF3C12]